MRNKLRFSVVLLTIASVFNLAGCKDPYGACAKAGADIASAISAGMNTVQGLQQSGVITAEEAVNVLGYLEYANKGDEAFLSCVATAHTSPARAGAFTTCANVFNLTLNNPEQLALIHVSNDKASTTIATVVQGVTSAVTMIISGLKGA